MFWLLKSQARQKVDIPSIKTIFTEYTEPIVKPILGCQTIADFSKNVIRTVSYGENREGLIGYFYARQYFPFLKKQEVFNDVFNINISEGGIHLLNRFADKITSVYEIIKQRIIRSYVIGANETGVKVNGDYHWFWGWKTPKLTYIVHSKTGKEKLLKLIFQRVFQTVL